MKLNKGNSSSKKTFGLNEATIIDIRYLEEYNDKPMKVLLVNLDMGDDKPMKILTFPVTKVFSKNSEVVYDVNAGIGDETVSEYQAEMVNLESTIYTILKSFLISDEAIEKATEKYPENMNSIDLLKMCADIAKGKCENVKVHVFLQYPWSCNSEGKKYLNVAKNTKHGPWIAPYVEGAKQIIDPNSGTYHYENSDGERSDIYRTKWFMESQFSQSAEVGLPPAPSMDGNNSSQVW